MLKIILIAGVVVVILSFVLKRRGKTVKGDVKISRRLVRRIEAELDEKIIADARKMAWRKRNKAMQDILVKYYFDNPPKVDVIETE